jgi:predicted amidohydrolase
MNKIVVALLQISACGTDLVSNQAKGEAYCRQASAMGADIALFPELWSVGYSPCPSDSVLRQGWLDRARDRDSDFVEHYCKLARELKMAIALTYLERWPGGPRNSVSLIDHHGEIVLTYAKTHTCRFDWETVFTPGESFPVAELDTKQGAVRVGAMICFDREFPEPARILMLAGAELILVPNACQMEASRLGQFRTRAFENMVGVAMANYPVPQENGHSVAYDPICFTKTGPRDPLIVEAGEVEGIVLAPFNLDDMRHWRTTEVWGNAYRRPELYGSLVSLEVADPFRRSVCRSGDENRPLEEQGPC